MVREQGGTGGRGLNVVLNWFDQAHGRGAGTPAAVR